MDEKVQLAAMQLIIAGGNAKSFAFEALKCAKQGDFAAADNFLKQSNDSLMEAHHAQTELLTNDAKVLSEGIGELTQVSLLMVHAQDHLMNAITFKDLAEEIIDLRRS